MDKQLQTYSLDELEKEIRHRKEHTEIRIPRIKPVELGDINRNPALPESSLQYEITTLARYEDFREHKSIREFLEKHSKADIMVSNQSGVPIYALYHSTITDHVESNWKLFRDIRAMQLNDWEEYDYER